MLLMWYYQQNTYMRSHNVFQLFLEQPSSQDIKLITRRCYQKFQIIHKSNECVQSTQVMTMYIVIIKYYVQSVRVMTMCIVIIKYYVQSIRLFILNNS